jgi:DNA-binding transcriptional LysR family regulator
MGRPAYGVHMREELRVGFVTGATPDKWARAWRERRAERLLLVTLTEEEQEDAIRRGEVDMALVRLPVDTEGLHCVRLYDERQVAVAGREHLVSAADDVTLADLADEQLVRPHASGWTPAVDQQPWPAMSEKDAVETVAAGTGVVILPMSVARLLQRKDVIHREVTDLPPSTIALVWPREKDGEFTQAFVGVVKGRSANSSRG